MARTLGFFVLLAALVVAGVWLANWQGDVTLDLPAYEIDLLVFATAWPALRIETSIGVLVLFVAVIAGLAALAYRSWGAIARAPRGLERKIRDGRRQRGYKALTQGMVAVAAGEAEEARRCSRRAETLLNEPPLTLLLAAQAAQLDGDEAAAKRYFETMLERQETRFLGLRGLLMLALREGEEAAALGYAKQAYALRPKTPWVLTSLAELSERQGDFEGAALAITEAAKRKALPAATATRQRAVVLLEQALAARAAGRGAEALKRAREAHKQAPGLVPATALLGELLAAAGRRREARKTLEKAWARAPHPALVAAYGASLEARDGIDKLKQLERLVAGAAEHGESHLALAEAALDARLWGEARRHLAKTLDAAPGERACRLMARLEEAEHGDGGAARQWLLRAGAASDATWVCQSCGTTAEAWSAHCGACAAFDGYAWRRPSRIALEPVGATAAESGVLLPSEVRATAAEKPRDLAPVGSGPRE